MDSNQDSATEVPEIEERSQRIMEEIGELLDRLHRRLGGESVAPRPWEAPSDLN